MTGCSKEKKKKGKETRISAFKQHGPDYRLQTSRCIPLVAQSAIL